METKTHDTSRLEEAHSILSAIAERRAQSPANPWDGIYYEMMARYFENILKAGERGQKVVTTSDVVPSEILYAMDIIPFQLDNAANTMVTSLRNQEEVFGIAKEFGFVPDLCSAHRAQTAMGIKGWYPQVDAVVWSH